MHRTRFFLYMICFLFLIGLFIAVGIKIFGVKGSAEEIAIIEVKGSIVAGESGSSLTGTKYAGSETLMRQIRKAAEDKRIKALLIHINSPGGSAAASEAVFTEILRFKKNTGKPVIAVMEDIAASGGYFIAVGADEIFANPSTLTGSIGVIMQFNIYKDLYKKYGIQIETIKSGKYKDMGNSSRDLTQTERDLLQKVVDQTYYRFVKAVMYGRNLSEQKVRELAQGQVFTGMEAQKLNLVDHLGNFYDAIGYLTEKLGIQSEPTLVYYSQSSSFERLFGGLIQKIVELFVLPKNDLEDVEILMIEESLRDSGVGNFKLNY